MTFEERFKAVKAEREVVAGDYYFDTESGELHKITGV